MLNRLRSFVGRIATWPVVALLFIGYVLCTLGFTARTERIGSELKLLDVRYLYAPSDVQTLFDQLNRQGDLDFYALTEVTLDLVFPFIYGALLLILIYRLFEPKLGRMLLLVPLIGTISDLLENLTIALMVVTYTGSAPGFASITTLFTLAKNLLVRLALVIVLVGAIRALILKRTGEGGLPRSAVLH